MCVQPGTWDLSSNECTLPFIVQGECLHCAGPRQVGPANRGRSTRDKEVFSVVLSIEKLMRVSTARIWPCTALSCTVSGVSVTQQ
jgi:hypothetical protein